MDADIWVQKFKNRNEVSAEYRMLLLSHGSTWLWWPELNRAIIKRWSPAALVYIKERAWRTL